MKWKKKVIKKISKSEIVLFAYFLSSVNNGLSVIAQGIVHSLCTWLDHLPHKLSGLKLFYTIIKIK